MVKLCISLLWVDFNSTGFGYYYLEGLIVDGVSGPIFWITKWVYRAALVMRRPQNLTG